MQTISNPQVTFVSGSSAELKVGGTSTYISQVGQLVSANNTSGTSNPTGTTGVGTNTVSTSTLTTGLAVNVNGAYENGVVLANLNIQISSLVGNNLNPQSAGNGTTIDLPQTTDERINNIIRVRPGDNLVMAGLVTSADSKSRQGIPLPGDNSLPQYGDDQKDNHELVVVVKPSVILFSDAASTPESSKKRDTRPLPAAVLIDKDGSSQIAMPGSAPPTATASAKPVPLAPAAPPALPLPTDTGEQSALVDQRMMQRGFSHAFDELLQPAPTSSSGGTSP